MSELRVPSVMSLPSLLKGEGCYVVRMVRFDTDGNQHDGKMLWPEVLICRTENEANEVRDFLNTASFQDSYGVWSEEEPELTYEQAQARWKKNDLAQYVIEQVPCLTKYPEIYRISESLMSAGERFEQMRFL